jgi:pimeloyl-ACP methyl ester carboxylesterase
MDTAIRRTLVFPDGVVSFLEWEAPAGAPLVVFSHANGFNASTYKSLLQPLAQRLRIIAWDMRGHGLTTLPLDQTRLPGWRVFRDDLIGFLDGLGVQPAVLAGHSLGATASLLAAAAVPSLAGALVLAEPVMPPVDLVRTASSARQQGTSAEALPLVAMTLKRRARFPSREDAAKGFTGRGAFKSWPPEVIADYVETGLLPEGDEFRLACPPQWEAAAFAVYPFRIGRLGAKVRVPVTILCGTENSATSDSELTEFVNRHPQTSVRHIEGASHFLPMEYPDIVRTEISRAAGIPVET